jgi:hypothetical protein
MKRTKNIPSYMGSVESFEGESIEKKVSKLIENNEPITDGAPQFCLTCHILFSIDSAGLL